MILEKITISRACSDGKHTFIAAHWQIKSSSHDCTLFVCQHCLLSVDKSEREVMMKCHHERIQEKTKAKLHYAEKPKKDDSKPTKAKGVESATLDAKA